MAVEIIEYIPNVNERPHTRIKSDKFNHEFIVAPQIGGYVFYDIRVTKGNLPKELSGRYTRMKAAVDAVIKYEHKATPSRTVERDRKAEKRNAAKVQREHNEHIRERADHGEEPTNLS